MTALAQSVTIDDTTYAAGTDHSEMPPAVVDRIRNPAAWVGGTAPALSATPYGKPRIKASDLTTASKARRALGINTQERHWRPDTALVCNIDRVNATIVNNTSVLTSGRLQLAGGLVVPAGTTITSVTFVSGTQAAATLTNHWACLVGLDRAVLVKSADATNTAWAANTAKSFTLATPYTPTTDTPIYAGLMVAGTTVPDLRGTVGSAVTSEIVPVLAGYSTTGLTNPASLTGTAAAITGVAVLPFCYLS